MKLMGRIHKVGRACRLGVGRHCLVHGDLTQVVLVSVLTVRKAEER